MDSERNPRTSFRDGFHRCVVRFEDRLRAITGVDGGSADPMAGRRYRQFGFPDAKASSTLSCSATRTGAARVSVKLTKVQVKGSLDISTDQPVSRQMESRLYDYYGWDPFWGDTHFGAGAIATRYAAPAFLPGSRPPGSVSAHPHLRSIAAIIGYHIQATDGTIGHVDDLLVDDVSWDIRYIVVDTRNWWPGEKILISPCAVQEIEWTGKRMTLDVARQQVKDSPRYDPSKTVDHVYEEQLHAYYGWPGCAL